MPATLDDNTSVHESPLDHYNSRDNQGRECSEQTGQMQLLLQPL